MEGIGEIGNIIMGYIAVWSWFIISNIFLVGSFVIIFSGETIGNNIMFGAFLFAWFYCLVVAMRRRSRLQMEKEINEQ